MNGFLALLQKNRIAYTLTVSAIFSVIIVNEMIQFAENIINNYLYIIFTLIIFYVLALITIKGRLWQKQ